MVAANAHQIGNIKSASRPNKTKTTQKILRSMQAF